MLPIVNDHVEGKSNADHEHPISEYVVKVASRCNLNCTYCYMYNLADSTWKEQPKFMSEHTFRTAVDRILEHAMEHKLREVRLIFHGGEPFLAGPVRFNSWCTYARGAFDSSGIDLKLSGQTNGLLFTEELGEVFLKHGVTFGVSIDGIPGKGDKNRLNHKGERVGAELQKVMLRLKGTKYERLFTGIISVINFEASATETLEYLLQFNPPCIDFHPPLINHDTNPCSKDIPLVGDWFKELFDHIVNRKLSVRVRYLASIAQAIVGNAVANRTRGNAEIWAGIIETNGAMELIDSLKSTENGITKTGLNIFNNTISDLSLFIADWMSRVGLTTLPDECAACPIKTICLGGYYPHRYSKANGFRNRDVYCNEWKKLIVHMYNRFAVATAESSDSVRD